MMHIIISIFSDCPFCNLKMEAGIRNAERNVSFIGKNIIENSENEKDGEDDELLSQHSDHTSNTSFYGDSVPRRESPKYYAIMRIF